MRMRHDIAVIDFLRRLEYLTVVNSWGIRIFVYVFEISFVFFLSEWMLRTFKQKKNDNYYDNEISYCCSVM